MRRWFIALVLATAVALFMSCGDDEGGPSGPGSNPEASTLTATAGSSNSINLTWTQCSSADFAEYRIYMSDTTGIQANPEQATVLQIVTEAGDTTFINTGLDWNTVYYYAIQTKDTENLYSWSNEANATTPDSGSGSGALTCYEIQGQQSSSPYEGQTVTVTGIVVAGSDEYYSSSFPYAVLADEDGGPWSGLLLYGDCIDGVERGDSIVIKGEVQEFYGMTELSNLEDLQVISTGIALPAAVHLTTAQVNDEQYESVLVSVEDAIVGTIGEHSYIIDDGSGQCYAGTRGDYTEPAQGDTLDATGTLWYEYDEWRIQPRDDNDVTINSGGGGEALTCYEVQGQQPDSPYNGQTVSVTGIITAGADDYTAGSGVYAALTDVGGGPWSGLLLYGSGLEGLQRGDSVTVTGVVDEYYEMTELTFPISYQVHSTGHSLPAPQTMTTGDLAPTLDIEQWESVFVTVSNAEVTQIGLPHYTWAIDDGSGECYAGTMGEFTYEPAVGDILTQITGMLWYNYDFKIQPRDDADVIQ